MSAQGEGAARRPTRIVQVYAARANASFVDRVSAALHEAGHVVVTGPFDPAQCDAVIVVWSGAAMASSRLLAAAEAPLAAGALVPVSIGRIEPPEGFRELPPHDLAGWAGDADEPRWQAVLDAIERAAGRDGDAGAFTEAGPPPVAVDADAMTAAEWRALLQKEDEPKKQRAPAGLALPFSRRSAMRMQAPVVFTMALIAAAIVAGFVSLASRFGETNEEPQAVEASAPPAATQEPAPLEVPPAPSLATLQPVSEPEAAPAAPDASETGAIDEAEDEPHDEIAALIVENVPQAEEAPSEPGRRFRDCETCPEVAVIPAGDFSMGAPAGELLSRETERPVVPVRIDRGFALGVREVTFAEYDSCVAAGACAALPDSGWGRGAQPAINVSWRDANAYVRWLSETTGASYRLPSEAEWEYAARAGEAAPFASGEALGASDASFDGAIPYGGAAGATRRKPSPAGSFAANSFGLFDMNGNVWEWTADCWSPSHAGRPADSAPRGGECASRVLKGGAFNTGGWRLRAAHRISKNEAAREYDNGFRVARDLD